VSFVLERLEQNQGRLDDRLSPPFVRRVFECLMIPLNGES
jgi:hypothetical protein